MKILLVEDDDSAGELIETLMRKHGYTVERAPDGAAALKAARQAPPDLIISDVMMPEMDGFILCRRLKEDEELKNIPVILYTGTVTEKDEEALALDMGAVRFIAKLTEPGQLLAAVAEELRKAAEPGHGYPRPPAGWEGAAREYLRIFSRKLQRKDQELLEARKKLAESDDRYRNLLESAPESMVIHRNGAILYANPAALRLVAAERTGQVLGRNLLEMVAPEFREFVAERIKSAMTETALSPLAELRILRADGKIVDAEFMSFPVVYEGGRARLVIVKDISERKRAEERLRASETRLELALRAAHMGVWSWEIGRDIRTFDPGACELLGIEYESFRGTAAEFFDRVHPEDRMIIKAALEKTIKTGAQYEAEYRVVRPDGRVRNMAARAQLTRTPGGAPDRINGVVWDVTGRKTAEAELRKSEEMLQRSQKLDSIGQLSGGIAHDLNNLLGPVLGYADIVRKSLPPGDSRRADLDEITKAADRAAGLVRQLLAFSRKQIMEPRVVNLNDTIQNIGDMLRRVIGERVRLTYALDPAMGCAKVDPGQMEQVILNLVLNARDAMPQGGEIVIETAGPRSLSSKPTESGRFSPDGFVRLSVRDAGCGMDAAVQARIFEPFFTTKPLGRGTGLGLSTVYGIVKQSGGSIQVKSEPGKGSLFAVYLPAVKAAPTDARSVPARPGGSAGPGLRVLIVEDDDSMRGIARRVLGGAGYMVSEAVNGRQALKFLTAAGENMPTVILTDLVMPEMDGIELIQAVTAAHPGIRILCMSGYSNKEEELRQVIGSKAAYLQKPFDPDTLLARMDELLK